jgi:hypothetical protein
MKRSDFPLQTQRSCIFQDMTPQAQHVALKLDLKLRALNRGKLLVNWDIGHLLEPVIQFPGSYGQDAVQLMARVYGVPGGDSALYQAVNLAREYTRSFVAEQAEKPMGNGAYITYEHLCALTRVLLVRDQQRLLELTRAEGLTVRALRRTIAELDNELRE